MTPAIKELRKKAYQAIHDYYKLYGFYPDKVGVHYMRIHELYGQYVIVPILPAIHIATAYECTPLPRAEIKRHIVYFAPVSGIGTSMNEVYVETPNNHCWLLSSTKLAELLSLKGE